jgi:hypothetical protein
MGADKTDVSELAPDVATADEIVRARFTVLRDRLLNLAEDHLDRPREGFVRAADVGALVSAAAHAHHCAAIAAMETREAAARETLEAERQAQLQHYLQQFMGAFQALEKNNEERFQTQREWVERELKARGMEPPKPATVLSIVPEGGPPTAAG